MKKILATLTMVCLMLGCLAGCKGGQASEIEKLWKTASKADSIEAYAKEQQEEQAHIQEVALETLNGDASLEQQFQAVALLCATEYQSYLSEQEDVEWKDGLYQFDYPVSTSYAESYLAKVNTEGEAFWTSIDKAFFPYDCLMPIFAAADKLEGQTLVNLLSGLPEDNGTLSTKLEDVVDEWILNNPGELIVVGDALMESGYFDEWSLDDWRYAFFYSILTPYQIREATLEDALAYINYLKSNVLPTVNEKFGDDSFQYTSELIQEDYYASKLTITVDEEITLQDALVSQETEGEEAPEPIEIEGKKVIALYRNLQGEEFEGSPTPLRLMGDFMLDLSEEEYPKAVAEADYYLVLTANYEEGNFYQTYGGTETAIQEINSSTSIDLYEAGTGVFLHHLGNVLETAPESIFTGYDDEEAQYPEMVGADVLNYMYHNINEPETYAFLLDHLSGKGEIAIDEPVTVAGWEITYHSAEIVKEFEDNWYVYSANDGCQFVKGKFTITNKGLETDTFLPMVYYIGEDPLVQVTDEAHENFYECVNAMTYSACLNNTTLEPGESKDGELFFEIPDELAQDDASLYIAILLGDRKAYYPLR